MAGLFGASTPPPAPVVPMQDPEAVEAARKRALAQRRIGTGRANTALNEQPTSTTLGGG